MKKIVLASGSARRKDLIRMVGIPFEIDPSDYKEILDQNMNPKDLVTKLSLGKTIDVAKRHPNSIVIGADSVIYANGKFLGKPYTKKKAIEMLKDLSGTKHLAITGFTIVDTGSGKTISETQETKIYFRKLTQKEIKNYVETEEPLDKAGAYAIQGKGALLVEKIDGDFFSVVGLPIGKLTETLKREFNVTIP